MSHEQPDGSYVHGDNRVVIDGRFYKLASISASSNAHFGVLSDDKHPLRLVLAISGPTFFKGENHALFSVVLSVEDTKQFIKEISELILNRKLLFEDDEARKK